MDFHKLDNTFLRSFDHNPLQKLSLTLLPILVILDGEDCSEDSNENYPTKPKVKLTKKVVFESNNKMAFVEEIKKFELEENEVIEVNVPNEVNVPDEVYKIKVQIKCDVI